MINRKFCILMTAVGLLMAVSLSGCAPVTVSSIPSGAGVYEKDSGKLLGTAPVKVNMIAGGKELVVRKDGYFSQTVAVSPIDPVSITVRLPRRDQVLVLSHPDGADLYVEGVGRVGKTPYRMDYEKPYRVFELRAEGYASRSFTVPEDPEGDIVIDLERDDAVHLVTTPKNAEVFDLQGKRLGGTPLAVPATEARSYEIRKDGYYSRQVSVGPETVSPFVVELEREPHITVYSEPEGAYVIHRGVVLGQTPFRHLV